MSLPAANESTISFVGDLFPMHPVMQCPHPGFRALLDRLNACDARFANLEGCIQQGEDWHAFVAGGSRGTTYMRGSRDTVRDVQAMGFNLLSTANNHSADFCEGGILTHLRYLDEAGLAHAGTGATLREAASPAYVQTPGGRFALVCASDWGPRGKGDLPYPMPQGVLAADAGPYSKGRPGVNLVRYGARVNVDHGTLDALRKAAKALGWDQSKAVRQIGGGRGEPHAYMTIKNPEPDTDTQFHFMGTKFVQDSKFWYGTEIYQDDVERNARWIREARKLADVVVFAMHQQGVARPGELADHVRAMAYAAIDAGADIFVAHGRGRQGGIEFYKGKAIIHGQPTFLLQLDQLTWIPEETLARWDLPGSASPQEFVARRRAAESASVMSIDSHMGEGGVFHKVVLRGGAIKEVEIHPFDYLKAGWPLSFQGVPVLAEPGSASAQASLEVTRERSATFGTKVEIRDGVGIARP